MKDRKRSRKKKLLWARKRLNKMKKIFLQDLKRKESNNE